MFTAAANIQISRLFDGPTIILQIFQHLISCITTTVTIPASERVLKLFHNNFSDTELVGNFFSQSQRFSDSRGNDAAAGNIRSLSSIILLH